MPPPCRTHLTRMPPTEIKACKEHCGYSANITETVDGKGSLVTDYQYYVNTLSVVDYLRENLENTEVTEETTVLIADGAYSSEELAEKAAEITTGLCGRKPRGILTQFKLSKDCFQGLSRSHRMP